MKLINFEYQQDYIFILTFKNNEKIEVDLSDLIKKHVSEKNLNTAKINNEWGCLEFNNGMVDIEPKTLYRYAVKHALTWLNQNRLLYLTTSHQSQTPTTPSHH